MGVLQAGLLNQPSAQVIDGSLKFVQSNKTYLKRTPGSAGNRRTWTYSAWIKRGDLASSERGLFSTFGSSHPTTALKFSSSHVLEFLDYQGGYICQKVTNQFFRDTSWYHIVIAIDTTLTIAEDRFKLYVNGERVTSFSTSNNISTQNQELDWNSATEHNLFMHGNEDTPYDGMGAQTYFIDGLQLGPSYFGFTDPLTGTWRPKKFRAEGTTVNDGTVWSNAVPTADGFRPGRAAADGFDGDFTTYVALNNTTFNLDVGSWGISGTMEVYAGANMRYATDGSGALDMTANGWTTVGDAGSISTLTFTRSDSNYPYFYAIRVDGVILTDSTTTNLSFGTNGFYLPMDGNSPIGQDKSGNGNDWTPVNFGGSNSVEKATGALPILEGAGGAVANFGVRTDANASSLVLALPLVGSANDVSNQINSGSTTKAFTANGNAAASSAQSNFYGGSFVFDGTGDYLSTPDSADYDLAGNDWTIEAWVYHSSTNYASSEGIIGQ